MTSVHRNPPPKLPSGSLLGIGIALVVVGLFSVGRHLLDQWRYNNAIQAYERADCHTALNQLNPLINALRLIDVNNYVPRAQEKKAECEHFQEAVTQQQEGNTEAALLDYLALTKMYEDSALVDPARQKIVELFQATSTNSLATSKVCDQLENLIANQLIPALDTQVSQFYLTCGKTYETNKSYERAIALYEQLLRQKPDDTEAQKLETALARATVADARYQGAREIGPPRRVTSTADGSTVVQIQNTSPRAMQITFSGPNPKFEKMESCQDCQIYQYEGPEICPGKGPVQRYTLAPGQYDIAVDLAEVPGEIIESWVADWELDEGFEYRTCFIVVHGLEREPEDSQNPEPPKLPLQLE